AELRRVRNVELARIAWRDFAGSATLDTTLAEISLLADCSIEAAQRFAVQQLEPRHRAPRDAAGKPLPLLVLGMGKLGGEELNFSSDVDLVFLYPDAGDASTSGENEAAESDDATAPETYFLRVAQLVIKLLDQVTEDGFVY